MGTFLTKHIGVLRLLLTTVCIYRFVNIFVFIAIVMVVAVIAMFLFLFKITFAIKNNCYDCQINMFCLKKLKINRFETLGSMVGVVSQ